MSDLRLQVHQPAARQGAQQHDPGAAMPVQGYAGHYCSVPRRAGPEGGRLLDDPVRACGSSTSATCGTRARSAYFNQPLAGARPDNPSAEGAFAMSQPAWDVQRRSVWYSDGNTGFYDVRLTNGVGRLLRR